jgi:hypothetical protein
MQQLEQRKCTCQRRYFFIGNHNIGNSVARMTILVARGGYLN